MAPQNEVQATAIGDVMKRTKKFRRSSPFLGAGAGSAGIAGFATTGAAAAAGGVAAGAGAAGLAGSAIASYLSRSVAHRVHRFRVGSNLENRYDGTSQRQCQRGISSTLGLIEPQLRLDRVSPSRN